MTELKLTEEQRAWLTMSWNALRRDLIDLGVEHGLRIVSLSAEMGRPLKIETVPRNLADVEIENGSVVTTTYSLPVVIR